MMVYGLNPINFHKTQPSVIARWNGWNNWRILGLYASWELNVLNASLLFKKRVWFPRFILDLILDLLLVAWVLLDRSLILELGSGHGGVNVGFRGIVPRHNFGSPHWVYSFFGRELILRLFFNTVRFITDSIACSFLDLHVADGPFGGLNLGFGFCRSEHDLAGIQNGFMRFVRIYQSIWVLVVNWLRGSALWKELDKTALRSSVSRLKVLCRGDHLLYKNICKGENKKLAGIKFILIFMLN